MNDRISTKPQKRLEICPKCAGYMRPLSPFADEARHRGWHDDTLRRSFGGVALRQFVCEKCQHTETFQVDELSGIEEDD